MPNFWEPHALRPDIDIGKPKFVCVMDAPSENETGVARCGQILRPGESCAGVHLYRPTAFSTKVAYGSHLGYVARA